MRFYFGIFFMFLFELGLVKAQERRTAWSVSSHYGTTIAHTKKIQSIKSNNPVGLQLDLAYQKDNQENYNTCNCYPQAGLSLAIFDYGNDKIVGQGIHSTIFLEPQFKVSKNNYFILRASAGLAFMNRPFDSIENPNNLAYSLPVSGFVSLGPGWRYYINSTYSAFILFPFNHVSNGGIKDPNIGLNFPSVQFGITKQNYPLARNFKRENIKLNFKRNHTAISFFFSSRTVKNGEKKRYLIYGLESSHQYRLSSLIGLNSAIEFYKDDALKERYKRENGIEKDRYRLGLMSGVQVYLGKFNLYHRLGIYLYDPGLYNGLIFHRHGLQYAINSRLSAGVEVKAHKEVANFLDFRIKFSL